MEKELTPTQNFIKNTLLSDGVIWKLISCVLFLAVIFMILYFSTKPDIEKSLNMLSIIGTLSTIILGIIAIWLSIYLFDLSSRNNFEMNNILSEIKQSSHTTEVVTRDTLRPLIADILKIANYNISSTKTKLVDSVGKGLVTLETAKSHEEINKARSEIFTNIDNIIGNLRSNIDEKIKEGIIQSDYYQDEKIGRDLGRDYFSEKTQADVKIKQISMPEKMKQFIEIMRSLELVHPEYTSVKSLREKKLEGDPELQEMIQTAMDNNILLTWRIPNEKKPQFPILVCKLNRDHPAVKRVIESLPPEA